MRVGQEMLRTEGSGKQRPWKGLQGTKRHKECVPPKWRLASGSTKLRQRTLGAELEHGL